MYKKYIYIYIMLFFGFNFLLDILSLAWETLLALPPILSLLFIYLARGEIYFLLETKMEIKKVHSGEGKHDVVLLFGSLKIWTVVGVWERKRKNPHRV